jgi:hypothetical protein
MCLLRCCCWLAVWLQEAAAVPGETTLLDVAKEAAKYVKVSPNPMLIAGCICLGFGGVLFIVSGAAPRSSGG